MAEEGKVEAVARVNFWSPLRATIPRGSYPTLFLGRLPFKITDPNQKTRRPKKGVGYEPVGKNQTVGALGLSGLRLKVSGSEHLRSS